MKTLLGVLFCLTFINATPYDLNHRGTLKSTIEGGRVDIITQIRLSNFRVNYPKYNHLYDDDFLLTLFGYSDSLNMRPNHIMAILMHESSLDPKAYNPYGDAIGLYQFTPIARRELGVSRDSLLMMGKIEQLDLVYQYLKPYKNRVKHYSDFAIIGAAPSFYGHPNWVVCYRSPMLEYRVNPTWDLNKDGKITIGELRKHYTNTARSEVRYFFNDFNGKRGNG